MELIYLWIEKYKNIEKEGFNFSPHFNCKFDGKNLTIKENKDYKSIFPENINVTAIVGKNGSGKSSIAEVLSIFSKFFIKDDIGKFILIVNNKEGLFYKSNFEINTAINKIEENKYIGFETYSYFADKNIKLSNIGNSFFIGSEENVIKLDQENIVKIIINLEFTKNFKLSSFMYMPSILTIINRRDKIDKIFEQIMVRNNGKYRQKARTLFDSNIDIYHKFLLISFLDNHFRKNINKLIDDLEGLHIDNLDDSELNCLKSIDCLEIELSDELIHSKDIFDKFFSNDEKKLINELTEQEKQIYSRYYNYFYSFDFIDTKSRHYGNLSHGEKTIFGQLIWIYYILFKTTNEILFIFDEPEISLHPEWQRKYLYEVYNLFMKFNSKAHFIITTHSPFLLSDIPKENIIFLKDGKNVSDEVEIDTFGANIHTLLSHGFFMEDGFMGEFSKEKINEVIKFLNGKDNEIKSKEEAQNIINMIGESIIKNQLQKMLDSKRLDKIDKIDELEEEIERLQQELKDLKNDKN